MASNLSISDRNGRREIVAPARFTSYNLLSFWAAVIPDGPTSAATRTDWVKGKAKLGQNCKYARWKSGAAFGFWKAGDDDCAALGNLIEISEQLDLIMVRAQNVSLERIIVFRRGDAGIGVGGFVA